MTIFRGDELMTLRLKWTEAPADTCYLAMDSEAEDDVVARRAAWLGT